MRTFFSSNNSTMNLKRISSGENGIYKSALRLKQKKYRTKERACLVEGKKLVREATDSGVEILHLLFRETEGEALAREFDDIEAPLYLLKDALFTRLSEMKSPEGVIAVCRWCAESSLPQNMDRLLVLDRISDPGNLGTLLRSAEAFGFNHVLLIESATDVTNGKVLRASMGSAFRVHIAYSGWQRVQDLLESGWTVYATDMNGVPYTSLRPGRPYALVIGSESHGVSSEILHLATETIAIPMKGKIESLNAAVSGSILMNYFDSVDK
jgi:TrmH family RNA methyltransferase